MPSRLFAFALLVVAVAAPLRAESRAERWWSHVATLADDAMEGRRSGTPGYQRAADYVAAQLASAGLKPGATDGWFQPVPLVEQKIHSDLSSAAIVSAGSRKALEIGRELLVAESGAPRNGQTDAPLLFAGYGFHLPMLGHDDLAGRDIKGAVIVTISGGPAAIPGTAQAHARRLLPRLLMERGAAGLITIVTPKVREMPWERQAARAALPGFFLDGERRSGGRPFFEAAIHHDLAEALFAGSGVAFADIATLADGGKPLPRVDLKTRIEATVKTETRPMAANNVVGVLPGSSKRLAGEYVVLSAHLDGLGIGQPVNGDAIYNGALDNAAGVATVIEIARRYQEKRIRPKRSMLFLLLAAEENGLQGSRHFAASPTVAHGSIVANLNLDMALPLWPLEGVLAIGAEESSLGGDAAMVAARRGYRLDADPFPERSSFVRSDHYNFVRTGIPALFLKFGFRAGSPQAAIERSFRATRYHAPSDDLSQPVLREEAVKFDDYVAALARRIANARHKPAWRTDSIFAPAPTIRATE